MGMNEYTTRAEIKYLIFAIYHYRRKSVYGHFAKKIKNRSDKNLTYFVAS